MTVQEAESLSNEQVDKGSVDYTDSDLTKEVTASPGKGCRPKRTVRPPERLIEICCLKKKKKKKNVHCENSVMLLL